MSLDDILDAALAIGPDQVSMRAIARHMNVGVSTLYTHVESREELLMLIADRMVEGLTCDESDPTNWERAVIDGAYTLRDTLNQQPEMALHGMTDPRWSETIASLNEEVSRFFVEAGFSAADAWLSNRAIFDLVEAHVVRANAHRRAGRTDLEHAAQSCGAYPVLDAAHRTLGAQATDRRFEHVLDCLVRGLRDLSQTRRR